MQDEVRLDENARTFGDHAPQRAALTAPAERRRRAAQRLVRFSFIGRGSGIARRIESRDGDARLIRDCGVRFFHAVFFNLPSTSLTTGRHLFARVCGISSTNWMAIGNPGRFAFTVERICRRLWSLNPAFGTTLISTE